MRSIEYNTETLSQSLCCWLTIIAHYFISKQSKLERLSQNMPKRNLSLSDKGLLVL